MVWRDSFVCVMWLSCCSKLEPPCKQEQGATWLIRTYGITDLYVRHDAFVRVMWLIRVCGLTQLRRDTRAAMRHEQGGTWLLCLGWQRYVARMSESCHIYVWPDSFRYICDLTHSDVGHDTPSYVWHDSFILPTRLIHMFDRTHLYVCHDSFIGATRLIRNCDTTHHTYIVAQSNARLIYGRDMNHSSVWHDSFVRVTWLILMGDMTHS